MSTERDPHAGEAPRASSQDPVELILRRHLRSLPRESAPPFQLPREPTRARAPRPKNMQLPWLFPAGLITLAFALFILPPRESPSELIELAEGLSFDPFSSSLPSDLFLQGDLLDEVDGSLQLTDPWFSEPLWSEQSSRKEDF